MRKFLLVLFIFVANLTFATNNLSVDVLWTRRSKALDFQVESSGFSINKDKYLIGLSIKNLSKFIQNKGNISIYWDVDNNKNTGRFPKSQGIDLQINTNLSRKVIQIIHWLGQKNRKSIPDKNIEFLIQNDQLIFILDSKVFNDIKFDKKSTIRVNLLIGNKRTDYIGFDTSSVSKDNKKIVIIKTVPKANNTPNVKVKKGDIAAWVIWQNKNASKYQVMQTGIFQDKDKFFFAIKIKDLEKIFNQKSSAGLYWNCDNDKNTGRFPKSQGSDVQFNIDLGTRKINVVRCRNANDRTYMTVYEDDYLVDRAGDVLYLGLRKAALNQLNIKDDSDFVFQISHDHKRTDRVYCKINSKTKSSNTITPALQFSKFGALKSTRVKKSFANLVNRKGSNAVVWDCGSERFAIDEKTPNFTGTIPALKIKAAKGETTSLFFAVEAKQEFSKLEVTPLALSSAKNSLSAKVQRIQYADYISDDRSTLYTDILLDKFPNKTVKRQFIAYHISIPKDAKPGIYNGKLQIKIDGKVDTPIPIEVVVFNFNMPKFPAMKSAFSIKRSHVGTVFKDSKIQQYIYNTMIERAATFRFGPRLPGIEPKFKLDKSGNLHIYWDDFDKRAKYLIDTLGVNTIQLPPGQLGSHDKFVRWNSILKKKYKNCDDPEFKSVFKQYVAAYAKHIKELGIEDKMLFVVWDEPYGLIEPLKGAKLIRETAPQIPIGIFIDRYDPGAKDIDIWLTTLQNIAKTLKEAKGKRVWLYNSNGVNNFRLPAADLRSFFFLADKHNIEGFLSSEVNVLSKVGEKDGVYFNHYPQHCLFYVSKDGKKVFDSWRLVLLRCGFNDFDYLTIYRNLLKKKNLEVPKWLTDMEPDFDVQGMPNFKINKMSELDTLREKIAREIEKLSR